MTYNPNFQDYLNPTYPIENQAASEFVNLRLQP